MTDELPDASAPDDSGDDGEDLAAQVEKWRALARKHEARAKKGLQAEQRLAELENASKTELERAQEAARTWQQRAESAELQVLRLTVAARKGLTAGQAKRLQGTTEEELEQDADELLAMVQDSAPTTPDRAPRPRLRPGVPLGPPETDPAKLAERVPRTNF